ncbi:MAG: hypothetical protein JSV56_03960 [Methanomassiliicoccales archaeon]|nr:MAG: hypothetical protein JSV56_03960 [Methanomassiliicoccales archaeon]
MKFKTKEELYGFLHGRMDRERFDSEIKKRYSEYEGLLSEDAIAYLIADEQGVAVSKKTTISDLREGESVSITAEIDEVGTPREFRRKNGSHGQVVNLVISDGTGSCRMTLWDKDVERVRQGELKPGMRVNIINGYVKVTDFGMEVNLGRWGLFHTQ